MSYGFLISGPDTFKSGLIEPHIWDDSSRIGGVTDDELDGDFTLIGWYKTFQTAVLPVRLWNLGTGFIVDVIDDTGVHKLRVKDGSSGISPDIEQALTTTGVDWTCIIVRRKDTVLSIFEGKTKLSDTTISVVNYGAVIRAVNKAIKCADLRVLRLAATDADIVYYYDDVIEREGKETLPRWL
jgi:hypothetical protein